MANRIYPANPPNPTGALGYDGSNFQMLFVDKQSDGDHALRISTPVDRAPSTVVQYYAAALTDHATTTRLTYTVANGKRALVTLLHARMGIPGATYVGQIRMYINGSEIYGFTVDNATRQEVLSQQLPCNIWLTAGDVLAASTFSTDPNSLNFFIAQVLTVFDA